MTPTRWLAYMKGHADLPIALSEHGQCTLVLAMLHKDALVEVEDKYGGACWVRPDEVAYVVQLDALKEHP